MGARGGENGDGWPPEGGTPDDLPELPPEWGVIVIPDDAAELDDDAAAVRKELRREARRQRWSDPLHLRHTRRPGREPSAIGVPLLIMSIAVLATLASLSAVAWPTHPRTIITSPSSAATSAGAGGGKGQSARPALVDLTIVDATGAPIRLRDVLPGVIMLVEGCACTELIASTSGATGAAGIALIAVGRTAPPAKPESVTAGAQVWTATDPQGALWGWVPGSPAPGAADGTGAATVLLVDAMGTVVRVLSTTSPDDFRSDLAGLRQRRP